jgi:hypothetical protein
MKHTRTAIAAALIVAGGVGCGDTSSPTGDQPGTAVVSLSSSNAADGAVSITVRGPGLSAATAASSTYQVFSRLAGSTELKVIVLGDAVRPGQLFTVPVGAVNRLSAYTVQIEQVADQADSLRPEVSSYGVSLAAERN